MVDLVMKAKILSENKSDINFEISYSTTLFYEKLNKESREIYGCSALKKCWILFR